MFREDTKVLKEMATSQDFLNHLLKLGLEHGLRSSTTRKPEPFHGEFSGVQFTLDAPTTTPGMLCQVLFVDVHLGDKTLQFVLKDDPTIAEFVAPLSPAQKEFCDKYSAKLYGVTEKLAVMERLHGLEGTKLTHHILHDSQAADMYGRLAGTLLVEAAAQGLQITDVSFIQGKNVIVDFSAGTVKCIERTGLDPIKREIEPALLCGKQLYEEINFYITAYQRQPDRSLPADMLFAFSAAVFSHFTRNELCTRYTVSSPLHPQFHNEWKMFEDEQLTPEKYAKYVEFARNDPTFSPRGAKPTQMLHPDLYTALQQKDIAALHHCIENNTTYIDVEDTSHPFYGAEVIQP